jgi:hypothetical protein
MRALVPQAIETVRLILDNDKVDKRGRPFIPPSVKLQAAQWVVEHLVGKPKQHVEADISVKLQGILASCLVVPDTDADGGTTAQPGSLGGQLRHAIDAASWDDSEADEDETDDS